METHPAHDVPCPICHAAEGEGCKYITEAEHNGWVHVGRVSALQVRNGHAAAREVFTPEKYPVDPRIVAARQNETP